jgi:hypothetical protein
MTAPKKVRCEMSGKPVQGPRELDGTAYCPNPKCLSTIAPTKKATREDGTVEYVYDYHLRRAYPPRWKPTTPNYRRHPSRDSGRRR